MNRGFTLIEIMMAMMILLIGIVGVLALFPVALRNSKMSFEDSVAAMIAENVEAAVIASLRRAPACQGGALTGANADPTRYVIFYGEGAATGGTGDPTQIAYFEDAPWPSYWAIPQAGETFYYPPREKVGAGPGGLDDVKWEELPPADRQVVPLGREWSTARLNNLPGLVSGLDPYRQYAFNLILQPSGTDPTVRLLQITIRIYRNFTGAPQDHPVHEFVIQAAYN